MDTRTVISGISFGNYSVNTIDFYETMNSDRNSIGFKLLTSALVQDKSLFSFNQIIYWLTAQKVKYELMAGFGVLKQGLMQTWHFTYLRLITM